MKKSSIILLVIVAIVAILAISMIGSYNGLVSKKEVVSQKLSDLDTTLQRRADLIPNLVNTVKGFTDHENEVIEKVTSAREKLVGANSIEDKQKANDELSESLKIRHS